MKRQVKTPRVKDKKGRFVTKQEAAKKGYEAYQLEQTLIKECKALDIELSEGYTLTELFMAVRQALPLDKVQKMIGRCMQHLLNNISELKPKEAHDIIYAWVKPQIPSQVVAQLREPTPARDMQEAEQILEKIAKIGREHPSLAPIIVNELYDETTNPR